MSYSTIEVVSLGHYSPSVSRTLPIIVGVVS